MLSFHSMRRPISILRQYLRQIGLCDAVLVFGNNSFILYMVPLLLLAARLFRKRVYLRPFGGDLDLYIAGRNRLVQSHFVRVLGRLDGLFPQTRQLEAALTQLGCRNCHYVPGCRPSFTPPPQVAGSAQVFRLIFLSQIKREKGPLLLLKALRQVDREAQIKVTCDFYGPVFDEVRAEFFASIHETPAAQYKGVTEVGTAARVIGSYDAMVLPTHFASEGHPGVIIEAMQAGVPVISTDHRAIPELITHGENGILIPTHDCSALAVAIKKLGTNPALRQRMGKASYKKGQTFRVQLVVPQILRLLKLPSPA